MELLYIIGADDNTDKKATVPPRSLMQDSGTPSRSTFSFNLDGAFLHILMQVSILCCQIPCEALSSQRFLYQNPIKV